MRINKNNIIKIYRPGKIFIVTKKPLQWSWVGPILKTELESSYLIPHKRYPMKIRIVETEKCLGHVAMEAIDLSTGSLVGFDLSHMVENDIIKKPTNLNSFT